MPFQTKHNEMYEVHVCYVSVANAMLFQWTVFIEQVGQQRPLEADGLQVFIPTEGRNR